MPEVIKTKNISPYHNDPLASHFSIKKTRELVACKYYWSTLQHNVEPYIKNCVVCLALKTIKHKPYRDHQSLPVLIYYEKDLLMNFITILPISTNRKGEVYDSILVIFNWLLKMTQYKPVKIIINCLGLAEIIINMVVKYHNLLNSIVFDKGSLFTSKFRLLLCYFFGIKYKLSTSFYPQTKGQIKRQNITIKAYL